mgnify:CR=1 FL=1
MKRLFLLFIAFLPALCLSAQMTKNFSIGPRVGVNFAKFTDTDNSESKPGLVAGLTSTYSINTNTGITFDALYSGEGVQSEADPKIKTDLDYLRLMLAFNYFFRDQEDNFRPKIYVGPTLGFLLSAENKVEDSESEVDVKDAYKNVDLGLAVGLGFNYRLGGETWLNVDGRFQPGLSDLRENKPSNSNAIRNQNFQFSVGLAFGL